MNRRKRQGVFREKQTPECNAGEWQRWDQHRVFNRKD